MCSRTPPQHLSEGSYEEIPYAISTAALFDRRRVLSLGGFDAMVYAPLYWEDTDLSVRAYRRGWKSVRVGDSHVWHGSGVTMKRILSEFRFSVLLTRNQLLFHWKNLSGSLLIRHACLLPKLILGSLRQRSWALPAAFLWALPRAPRAFAGRGRGARIDYRDLVALGAVLPATGGRKP